MIIVRDKATKTKVQSEETIWEKNVTDKNSDSDCMIK